MLFPFSVYHVIFVLFEIAFSQGSLDTSLWVPRDGSYYNSSHLRNETSKAAAVVHSESNPIGIRLNSRGLRHPDITARQYDGHNKKAFSPISDHHLLPRTPLATQRTPRHPHPKGTSTPIISTDFEMIPYDFVQPVPPVSANSGGVPSRKTLLSEVRAIWSAHASIKERLLFFCGNLNIPLRAPPVLERHGLVAYPGLFDEKYLPLLEGPDRIRLLSHYNLVAATYAEEKAYVMVNSDKDARNLDNAWNAFARPILEKKKVKIVWLDVRGERREAMYPPMVMPPGVKMRRGKGKGIGKGMEGGMSRHVEEMEEMRGILGKGQAAAQGQAKSESGSESGTAAKRSRVKVHFTYE